MPLHHAFFGNLQSAGPSFVDATRSISHDGVNEFITFTNYPNFDIDEPFSAAAWINPSGVNTTVFGKIDLAASEVGWRASVTVGGHLRFDIKGTPSLNNLYKIAGSGLTTDGSTWYHIGVSYNGNASSPVISLYVDGSEIPGSPTGSLTPTDTLVHSYNYLVGRRTARYFNGLLAGHSIWDALLTSDDFARIASAGFNYDLATDSTASNLVKWLYFDSSTDLESAGGVIDFKSNGDGTASNMTNAFNLSTSIPS